MSESFIIKYGLSPEYVSTWGYKEAIREIVQNFMDYGKFTINTFNTSYSTMVEYQNEYSPSSFEFLKVGFSKKENPEAIGKYGEGLKVALLVLGRLNIDVVIKAEVNGKAYTFKPIFYNDDFLGQCFGIIAERININLSNRFYVTFMKTDEYYEMKDYFISDDTEVIFSNYHGSIVNMPAGNIYVGGIYVANFKDIPRAYNLKASDIDLGRDRNFPNTFDIEYHCSKIFQDYCKSQDTIMDHSSTEVSYMDKLPNSFAEKVEPMMVNGNIAFNSPLGFLSGGIYSAANKNTKIMEKVQKLKVELTKRQSPLKLITEFNNKYSHLWYSIGAAKTDMNVILEKAKGWL